jgi:hypothetical protein
MGYPSSLVTSTSWLCQSTAPITAWMQSMSGGTAAICAWPYGGTCLNDGTPIWKDQNTISGAYTGLQGIAFNAMFIWVNPLSAPYSYCKIQIPSGTVANEYSVGGGCRNGGTCSAPNTCTCASGYTGQQCTQYVLVIIFINLFRWSCASISRFASNACSSRGACTAPNTCSCNGGFSSSVAGNGLCDMYYCNGKIITTIVSHNKCRYCLQQS